MLYSVLWTVTLVLLALWSVGVWLLHGLLAWSVSGAGALADQAQQAGAMKLPEWLAPWLAPQWVQLLQDLTASLLPALESALSLLPSAAGWLSPLAWLVWALGLLILLAAAAFGQTLIWTGRKVASA